MEYYHGLPVTTLIDYTDDDGDLLRVIHDPGGDGNEDIWIGVTNDGHTSAVRIPLALLRERLS